MSEVLVVGSLAYDSIETPKEKRDKVLGGSANWFSVAASMYSKVRVVGVVGEDYAEKDRQVLESRGVDLEGMQVQQGKTFFWAGAYHGDMNEAETRSTELNVFGDFNPELPVSYKDSRFVFLANISPDLQLRVLEQVKSPLFVGSDTMNFWITGTKRPDLEKVLSKVDAVLINEGESKLLTGESNAIAAAKIVRAMGPKQVVIKRGEYGFVLYNDEGYFILPAYPIAEVKDPTGAGDSFAGAFFGFLAKQGSQPDGSLIREACLHGCVMASFSVQDFSADSLARVTPELFAERFAEYRRVVQLS